MFYCTFYLYIYFVLFISFYSFVFGSVSLAVFHSNRHIVCSSRCDEVTNSQQLCIVSPLKKFDYLLQLNKNSSFKILVSFVLEGQVRFYLRFGDYH